MPINSALKRQRQENCHKPKGRLNYRLTPCLIYVCVYVSAYETCVCYKFLHMYDICSFPPILDTFPSVLAQETAFIFSICKTCRDWFLVQHVACPVACFVCTGKHGILLDLVSLFAVIIIFSPAFLHSSW